MRNRIFKAIIVPASLGLAVGLLMAVPFCFDESAGRVMSVAPVLQRVWSIANLPAFLVSEFSLSQLNSPGHGVLSDTGLWVASALSLVQWTFLGFLVGLWRCRKLRGHSEPPSDAGKANPGPSPVK
jgi:hypothetical protein